MTDISPFGFIHHASSTTTMDSTSTSTISLMGQEEEKDVDDPCNGIRQVSLTSDAEKERQNQCSYDVSFFLFAHNDFKFKNPDEEGQYQEEDYEEQEEPQEHHHFYAPDEQIFQRESHGKSFDTDDDKDFEVPVIDHSLLSPDRQHIIRSSSGPTKREFLLDNHEQFQELLQEMWNDEEASNGDEEEYEYS